MILSCEASAGQQAADPSARPVNDVQSAALAGDTNPYDSLPTWKSSDGHRYLVWKAYLAVAPAGSPYRVVTVTSPGSARLFYASPAKWGAESGEPVVPPPPRSVRMPRCGPRYTGYTGGILVTRPACVTLTVAGPGSATRTVRVPVLVPRCLPLAAFIDGGMTQVARHESSPDGVTWSASMEVTLRKNA